MRRSFFTLAYVTVRRTGTAVGFLLALTFLGCGGKDRYAPEIVQPEDPGPGERYVESLFAIRPNGRQDALTEIASIRSQLRLNAASKEFGGEFDRATSDRERALAAIAFAEQLPKSDDDDPRHSTKNALRAATIPLLDPAADCELLRRLLQGIALEFQYSVAHRDDRVAAALRDRAFRLGPLEPRIDGGALERDSFYSAIRLAEYEWSANHRTRAIDILRAAHSGIESVRVDGMRGFFDWPSDRIAIETALADHFEDLGDPREALIWLDRAVESKRHTMFPCSIGREECENRLTETRERLTRALPRAK